MAVEFFLAAIWYEFFGMCLTFLGHMGIFFHVHACDNYRPSSSSPNIIVIMIPEPLINKGQYRIIVKLLLVSCMVVWEDRGVLKPPKAPHRKRHCKGCMPYTYCTVHISICIMSPHTQILLAHNYTELSQCSCSYPYRMRTLDLMERERTLINQYHLHGSWPGSCLLLLYLTI